MKLPIYQIDAFTSEQFKGNPAAVCPLENWIDDAIMQNIAKENNLSETAFFVKNNNSYDLRWFTPYFEIDLCGHATLASAYVIFNYIDTNASKLQFNTKSGTLEVYKEGSRLSMIFPNREGISYEIPESLIKGLGKAPKELYKARDYLAVFENEADIKNLNLDINELKKIKAFGIIVTAKGDKADFVSRYFSTEDTIFEDPVTGSSHSTLVPYWNKILKKDNLVAYQLSDRGGKLYCTYLGDKIKISGEAVSYLEGFISID